MAVQNRDCKGARSEFIDSWPLPAKTITVEVALAIRRPFSSVTLHVTRPTVRPLEITSASAFNSPVHTGRRKLIFNSRVVKLSPAASVVLLPAEIVFIAHGI
jgi:hypothetical protein